MKLNKALQKVQPRKGTTYYADIETEEKSKSKNKMDRWGTILKKGNSLSITYAINKVPRIEISSLISKLSRSRYKKHPGTEIAISKLKWRRGY